MSPFGRRQSAPRTPEERERARLEREAARAAREGRPAPEPPPPEEPAWVDEPVAEEPAAADNGHADESWDYGDPVSFDGPPPSVPDAGSREAWDNTDAWDAAPAPAAPEPDPVAEEQLAPAAEDERPGWDDTGAWDPAPPQPDPPAAEPAATEAPAPTLGEEIAAVDRGWFEDDPPPAQDGEPGQETVEWDVLANKPKTPAAPPADRPAGVDDATVEFDVLSGAPKRPVAEPATQASSEPAAPTPTPTPAPAAAAPTETARFADEHDRPVPTRRVNRARTLPPTPPLPGEKRRTRRGFGRGSFLLVVLALLVAVALYLVNALFQPLADPGTGEVRVTVPRNSSAGDVAKLLEQEGVVDSAFFMEVRTRLSGKSLKAGDFTLQQGMPYGDAITALSRQPEAPPTIKVAIPEGRARREAAPLVKKAGLRGSYLAASEKASGFNARGYGAPKGYQSLEGFLFPATYELKPNGTARQLVQQQLGVFEREIAKVGTVKARINGRKPSTYSLLKIASMIEREATLPKERRLISAVIYNRLEQGMPLGIDATIRYATRNWSSPLKQSELDIDSDYNTRRRTGLPPTPIGSPGLASIRAAANPANVDYLFYVVKPKGDGAHNFSSTDAEFQKDVDAYNREREKRGGKDPSSSDGG